MFYKALGERAAGNQVTARVDIPKHTRRQAVIVTASGSSRYSQGGAGVNAGITLTIQSSSTNAQISDDSFEGESSTMIYRANCAHTFVVDPGFQSWVTASVTPLGVGGAKNHDSDVFLSVVAIPGD